MNPSPVSRIAICLVNHLDILSNEQVHFKNFLYVCPIPENLETAQQVADFVQQKIGVYELKEIVVTSAPIENWVDGQHFKQNLL